MSFDRPLMLLALLVPIVLAIAKRRRLVVRPRYAIERWGGPAFPSGSVFLRIADALKTVFLLAGYAALVIASAGPNRITRSVVFMARGADIVFVIDVSPSMGARDLAPDRFGAAKNIVDRFMSEERNEAVGIVAFASEAALVSPPTTDYEAVRRALAALKPGALGEGTAIGTGLAIAVRHAAASLGKRKKIVLLTDGEDNGGAVSPATASELATRYGVAVVVVGVGSRGDVPIEYVNPKSGERVQGTYRSGFDEESLRSIASSTGGMYLGASDDAGIDRVFESISAGVPVVERKRAVARRIPEAFRFLSFACALLALGWIVDRFALGGVA